MRHTKRSPEVLEREELAQVSRLLRLLSHDYWLPAAALARDMNLGTRQLRKVVHRAREYRLPIISGNFGYKLRKTAEEAEAFARRVGSNARGQLAAASMVTYGTLEAALNPGMFDAREAGR